MAGDAQQTEGVWYLGSFTKTEDEGLAVSLLRSVDEDERRGLQEAAEFLRSIQAAATYSRFFDAVKDCEARLQRVMDSRSPVELSALERAIQIGANLAAKCADTVIENTDGYHLVDHAAREALVVELRTFRSSASALSVCEAVAAAEPPLLVPSHGDGRLVLRDPAGADPFGLLGAASADLQKMLAIQLRGLRAAVTEASLALRRVTAEVLDGVPSLIRYASLEEAQAGRNSFQPDDLALSIIPFLARRLRRAERLLADASAGEAGPALTPTPAVDPPSPPVTEDTPSSAEPEPTPRAEGPEVAPPGVLDLRLVVEHLSSMTSQLERAWSDALGQVEATEAHTELLAEWNSLLRSIAHWTETRSAQLRQAGVEQEVPQALLALDPNAVVTSPTSEQERWVQLQVALLQAVSQLVNTFNALTKPSRVEVSLSAAGEEQLRAWWEAGAFAAANDAARFVLRLQEEIEVVEEHLKGGTAATKPELQQVFERLEHTQRALASGDPEAALIHLNVAYRAATATEPGSHEEVIERLVRDPASAGFATAAVKVAQLAAQLGDGAPVDLGAVTVTVLMGASELQRRLVGPPRNKPEATRV